MSRKEVTVLLVDDDEVDLMAIKRAFKRLRIANPLVEARNGQEALQILRGEAGREPLPRPYIILLDLNMPVMTGLEFLDAVREDPALHEAIIFVLTTSNDDQDRVAAYAQNVAGYIVKSDPSKGFLEAIEMIDHYWRVIEMP